MRLSWAASVRTFRVGTWRVHNNDFYTLLLRATLEIAEPIDLGGDQIAQPPAAARCPATKHLVFNHTIVVEGERLLDGTAQGLERNIIGQ